MSESKQEKQGPSLPPTDCSAGLFRITGAYRLKFGDRIRRGDFWRDWLGELRPRERVSWRERLSAYHCPHFRIGVISPEPNAKALPQTERPKL